MPIISAQTRKQLRQSIGLNLGAVKLSTTTSAGLATSFTDSELPGSDKFADGKHFVQVSGANDGSIRVIDEYSGGAKTGRFRTAMGATVASGVSYELWDSDMPPERTHDYINRAIRTVTRKGAPTSTDITIHTSTRVRSYTLPTTFIGVQHVLYRASYDHVKIDNCDSVWSELVDADVTASLDSEDDREGSGSCKFVLAAGLGAGDIIASEATGTLDLSGMTHCEWWMKSSVATAAADLQLILSSTANAGTETELLSVPALVANIWTRVRVALANPYSDTAIVSAGLKHTVDLGAATVHTDRIEATEEDSEQWERVHWDDWRIDSDRGDLVFTDFYVGHSMLKIIGVKLPTELTADTSSCDIDPEYIIDYATSQLMLARADRKATSRESANTQADVLYQRAQRRMSRMDTPSGVRWVL